MSKLYYTQEDISSALHDFLKIAIPNIRKTQLNIIPSIIFGMIMAESSSVPDIARELKDDFSLIQYDSVIKRIRRLFNNKYFDPYSFYNSIIKYIISNYKTKHSDKRVHITFDHMYSHDNYTVFMITMRVGKQGIPLYFDCFKGINNPIAFYDSTIIKGISTVSKLFDDDFDLIFLADRWFNSSAVLNHIDSLNHTYCVRLKTNICAFAYVKKERHYIRKHTGDLFAYQCHPTYHHDVYLYEDHSLKANVTIGKLKDVDDPWIIVTNGNTKRALKDYSYRFGSIEAVFKNQKSNGFFIEAINNANIKAFSSMYSLVCFSVLFLTMIGADYSKNTNCYKDVKITTHKYYKDKGKVRVMSLFKTGLTLFKRAFNSAKYIRIPFHFVLYDI